jgi:hypothetical protein
MILGGLLFCLCQPTKAGPTKVQAKLPASLEFIRSYPGLVEET